MTDLTSTTATYMVPAGNLDTLRARIGKLAKRAVKLGFAPDAVRIASETFDHDEPIYRMEVAGDGSMRRTNDVIGVRKWFAVVLEAPLVKLAGWRFVASLAHTSEGNIISAVPGESVPERYRSAVNECDHCRTDRTRLETFVVVNDDGRSAQVGRTCLMDFLGQDPHKAAALAELLGAFGTWAASMDEEDLGGKARIDAIPLDIFLAQVAQVVRVKGWTSRTNAREYNLTATADIALTAMTGIGTAAEELRRELGPIADGDDAMAADAIEWIESDLAMRSKLNDYEHNLVVLARIGQTTIKAAGLAASMIVTYQRARATMQERKRVAKLGANSEYQGEVGKRLKGIDVTIDAVIPISSDWGTSELVKFHDATGNVFVWFNSGVTVNREHVVEDGREDWRDRDPIGMTVRIDGTVKKHDSYQGTKQTGLNRVVIWSAAAIETANAKAVKAAAKAAKGAAKATKQAA